MSFDYLITCLGYLFLFIVVLITSALLVGTILCRIIPSPKNQRKLNLRNKTVLLTGASSGIGKEMAYIMHAKGAKLILASRDTRKLEELCKELAKGANDSKNCHRPDFLHLDLDNYGLDDASTQSFVKKVQSLAIDGKTVDVLVNNAGMMAYGSGKETKLEVFRRMMQVNYFGHVALTKALLEHIPDDGAIVEIGSIVGRVALPYLGAYAASKHAIQAFFDSLRGEDRPLLQFLTVSPGYVNTELGSRALNGLRGTPSGTPDPGQVSGMSANNAATEIVKAMEIRETELLLAPFLPRLLLSLRIFTPNLMWWGLGIWVKSDKVKKG